MSFFSRRDLVIGLVAATAGCGFRPLHQRGEGEAALSISLQEASDPETYAFRERLRRRLGHTTRDVADFTLEFQIVMQERPVAINPASDVTRYQVEARANWMLSAINTEGGARQGVVRTLGGYDATAAAFAARSAQKAERLQLAEELAELTATRILAAATDQQ